MCGDTVESRQGVANRAALMCSQNTVGLRGSDSSMALIPGHVGTCDMHTPHIFVTALVGSSPLLLHLALPGRQCKHTPVDVFELSTDAQLPRREALRRSVLCTHVRTRN